jgi:hypothetical protein
MDKSRDNSAISNLTLSGFAVLALALAATIARAQDPLPSWNDGPAKQAIVNFVAKVTKEGSSDFVSPAERVAAFDNDGTLWAEQPMYFIDDKEGKPIGINEHIGRRPIAAFGNSNGDRQMLEWTQAGGGARLMMLVHHDDAVREFAYGAESKIGTFGDALMADAKKNGWPVISMKDDWKTIFAFEK